MTMTSPREVPFIGMKKKGRRVLQRGRGSHSGNWEGQRPLPPLYSFPGRNPSKKKKTRGEGRQFGSKKAAKRVRTLIVGR